MIWLAWRQFRVQAVVVFSLLVIVAIVAAITGPHLSQVHDAFLAACKKANDCGSTTDLATSTYRGLQIGLQALVLLLPVLLGLFWGAPLVAREFETGTYRLAWTQSVSRRRWAIVKLAVVALGAMAASGLLSLVMTWWSVAPDAARQNRFGAAEFGLRGVAPIGYAAFALAFGVAAGVIIRRVLPAMVTTLVAYVATRLAVTYWVRPHFMSPVRASFSLFANIGFSLNAGSGAVSVMASPPVIPNAWVVSTEIVNNAGQGPTSQYLAKACPNLPGISGAQVAAPGGGVRAVPDGGSGAFPACVAKLARSFHDVTAYQPAGRYWAFQGLETAVFLALAVALGALTLWWLRHRVG